MTTLPLLRKTASVWFEDPVNYAQHNITAEDKKAVMDVLDGDWIAGNGPVSEAYAGKLCQYTGYDYAIPVTSGTVALYVAYAVMAHEFDFLTIPNLTFVATANTALRNRVTLNTVDVDDASLVSHGSDIGVSFAGYPAAKSFISDDAHGLSPNMAKRGGVVSVLSTHAVKQVATGEGGAILTNHKDIYDSCAKMVDQGRTEESRFGYGMNFRLSDINCALGLSQLNRAGEMFLYRQELAKIYYRVLAGIDEIRFPADHTDHAWHLYVTRFASKEMRDFIKAGLFDDSNIKTQIHSPPLTSYPHIGGNPDNYPVTYDAWNTGLSLPIHNGLSFTDVKLIADAVKIQVEKWYNK